MISCLLHLCSSFTFFQSSVGKQIYTLMSFDKLTITPPSSQHGIVLINDNTFSNVISIHVTGSDGKTRYLSVSSINNIPAIHITDAIKAVIDAKGTVHLTSWVLPVNVCNGSQNVLVSTSGSYTLDANIPKTYSDTCIFATFSDFATVQYTIKSDVGVEVYEYSSISYSSPFTVYTNSGPESKFTSTGTSFVRFKDTGLSNFKITAEASVASMSFVGVSSCGTFSFSKATPESISYESEGLGNVYSTCHGGEAIIAAGWIIGTIIGVVIVIVVIVAVVWACCCGCACCSICASCFSRSTTVIAPSNRQVFGDSQGYVYIT